MRIWSSWGQPYLGVQTNPNRKPLSGSRKMVPLIKVLLDRIEALNLISSTRNILLLFVCLAREILFEACVEIKADLLVWFLVL